MDKRTALVAAVALLIFGSLAGASPINLLVNPGFETGDTTGWTITGDFIGVVRAGSGYHYDHYVYDAYAYEGDYAAAGGSGAGTPPRPLRFTQVIHAVPGSTIRLGFYFATDFDRNAWDGQSTFRIYANGQVVAEMKGMIWNFDWNHLFGEYTVAKGETNTVVTFEQIRTPASLAYSFDGFYAEGEPLPEPESFVVPERVSLRVLNGSLTVFFEAYEAAYIRPETVALTVNDGTEVIPARPRPTAVRDRDRDLVRELVVKFDRDAVVPLLSPGENLLHIYGQLTTGEELLSDATIWAVDVDAVNFFRRAAQANRAVGLAGERVYRALTRRAAGPASVRGPVRRCLRLIQRLLAGEVPSSELIQALEGIGGAVEGLGSAAEPVVGTIDAAEQALYGKAQEIAGQFKVLAAHFGEEAKVWQRARSVRRPLDREAVGDWLDAESAQLGLLSESLDSFRDLAAGLGDLDQAQALTDLADATEAVLTSLADYVSALEAQIDLW